MSNTAPARVLELKGLTKHFGGLTAVDDVSIEVRPGSIHSIVGPNGAGKTTLFHMVSGFLRPDAGRIVFEDTDIGQLPVARRISRGIVRTFQNIRLFSGLTVRENVQVGQHVVSGPSARSLWPFPTTRDRQLQRRADELIDRLRLSEYAEQRADGLPYGVQKRLELARALASEPKLLMLDEPTAGMNDDESREIMECLMALPQEGLTILLVEHDMNVVMGASEVVSVLNFGAVIAEGTPAQIQSHPAVIEAYLGTGADAE